MSKGKENNGFIMMLSTLTPTHPGSGTELSYVDLPIQREGHTGFPKMEASTVKGSLRHKVTQCCEGDEKKLQQIEKIFGPTKEEKYASAVSFSDARLLFFPVKSTLGLFAWVTCPYVVQRFLAEYRLLFGKELFSYDNQEKASHQEKERNYWEELQKQQRAYVPTQSQLVLKQNGTGRMMLEEYAFQTTENPDFEKFVAKIKEHLPDQGDMANRLLTHAALIPDDDFGHFAKYSTEIAERIKIDPQTGTVQQNALFSEEYLPPECLFYSLVFFKEERVAQKKGSEGATQKEMDKGFMEENQVQENFKELCKFDFFQIGADETLGKGLVKKSFWEGDGNERSE